MSTVNFRAMSADDIPGVLAIEEASFDTPWTLNIFKDCLRVSYDCWIVQQGNGIVGYLIFSRVLDECHILNFAIAPTLRQTGLGCEAMQLFIKFCIENQLVTIYLEVRKGNSAAVKLYKKLGFVQIAVRKQYYQVPGGREDAIVMGLHLVQPDE